MPSSRTAARPIPLTTLMARTTSSSRGRRPRRAGPPRGTAGAAPQLPVDLWRLVEVGPGDAAAGASPPVVVSSPPASLLMVALSPRRPCPVSRIPRHRSARREQVPRVVKALEGMGPRSSRAMPEPTTRSRTVRETRTSPGPAAAMMRAPMWTAIPPTSSSRSSSRCGGRPGSRCRCRAARSGGPGRSGSPGRARRRPPGRVAGALDPPAPSRPSPPGRLVVGVQQLPPALVAGLLGPLGRADDVGEQDRGQQPAGLGGRRELRCRPPGRGRPWRRRCRSGRSPARSRRSSRWPRRPPPCRTGRRS